MMLKNSKNKNPFKRVSSISGDKNAYQILRVIFFSAISISAIVAIVLAAIAFTRSVAIGQQGPIGIRGQPGEQGIVNVKFFNFFRSYW